MATGRAEVTTTGLRVRKGAGITFPVLGTLTKGDIIEFTALTGGWYHIKYNGEPAFVSAQYTKLISEDNSESSYNITPVEDEYTVMAAAVKIRREPSIQSDALGTLRKGDIVKANGETAGWLRFSYKGSAAFVVSEYTKKLSRSGEEQK